MEYGSYNGYHCLPNWTLNDKQLSSSERQLLSYVYYRARRRNWCWFKMETACTELEMPLRTLRWAKRKLVNRKLILVLKTVSSNTWGRGIDVYVVPDRLLPRGAQIPIPEDLSKLPPHLVVDRGSDIHNEARPAMDCRVVRANRPAMDCRALYEEQSSGKKNNSCEEWGVPPPLRTNTGDERYSAAERDGSRQRLSVPDKFEEVLAMKLDDPPRVRCSGKVSDPDAAPESEQTARSCSKAQKAAGTRKPRQWAFLWRHWQARMLEQWGAGKVGANPTGPDIGNLKVILDHCGYDLNIAKGMVDILTLDWAAVRTKCWQAKNMEFPTVGLLKQLREFLHAQAHAGRGVIDSSHRVSAFDREKDKAKQLTDPQAEMERRMREWDRS